MSKKSVSIRWMKLDFWVTIEHHYGSNCVVYHDEINHKRYTYTYSYTVKYKYTGRLCCFRYKRFINSWLRPWVTQGEWHNFYSANHPNARRILWCLRSLSMEIWKIRLHLQRPKSKSQRTLLQNPQILRTISSGHDVIHTPASFPIWGFIMTMVIVIFFAREHKTVPNDYEPEPLTRIVQSPTKLNDKI